MLLQAHLDKHLSACSHMFPAWRRLPTGKVESATSTVGKGSKLAKSWPAADSDVWTDREFQSLCHTRLPEASHEPLPLANFTRKTARWFSNPYQRGFLLFTFLRRTQGLSEWDEEPAGARLSNGTTWLGLDASATLDPEPNDSLTGSLRCVVGRLRSAARHSGKSSQGASYGRRSAESSCSQQLSSG